MIDDRFFAAAGMGLLTTAPLVHKPEGRDLLIRWTSTDVMVGQTADLRDRISQFMGTAAAEIAQLKDIVHWQHDLIDYNATFQAYLMEQLTDDEFAQEAEKYAYEPEQADAEQLAASVERIYALTGIAFTPSDICGLFRCDHDAAVSAVARALETYPELSHLVPENRL